MQVIDETPADIRRLVEGDFGPFDETREFNLVFLDWLHYRARRIWQHPRKAVVSAEVLEKQKSYPAIAAIRRELEVGGNLSPWLSDRVRRKPQNPRADLMFNDWQIAHFHLGSLVF